MHSLTLKCMNLNSRLFDRIRVKQAPLQVAEPEQVHCDYPGCKLVGEHRAPMGRNHEGQYFCFCIGHVREYNATYNYFTGMSDAAIAKYQKEAIVGHRPTWSMGVNRAAKGHREEGQDTSDDPIGIFRSRFNRKAAQEEAKRPRYGLAATKALTTLGLDDSADKVTIKARYKEWVKRLHPDANGGDRSNEERLREIIHAYNHLKLARLV